MSTTRSQSRTFDIEATGLHLSLRDDEKLRKERKLLEDETEEVAQQSTAVPRIRHYLSVAIERIDAVDMSVNRAFDKLRVYDGLNTQVLSYSQALRRNRDILTPDSEATFVRLLERNLNGRTYSKIEGGELALLKQETPWERARLYKSHEGFEELNP
ncbi:hypothetical protein WN48_07874 [Eufriesea mexicana]|nr:hypothetical protein WN48_07874 [Eufriesea mexicana]